MARLFKESVAIVRQFTTLAYLFITENAQSTLVLSTGREP